MLSSIIAVVRKGPLISYADGKQYIHMQLLKNSSELWLRLRRCVFRYQSEALLVVASLVVAIGVAEFVVMKLAPQPTYRLLLANTPAMFRESDVLPFALRPGYQGRFRRKEFDVDIRINGKGYRGQDFDPDNGAHYRVLVVGNSFTFGHGVGEGYPYPSQLQRLLSKRDRPIEVINAGFASGDSPDTYYLYLRRYGLSLKPDIVLVGFSVATDIDNYRGNEWTKTDDAGLPLRIVKTKSYVDAQGYLTSRVTPLGYSIPILRESHLFHLVGGLLRRFHEPSRGPLAIYAREYSAETWAAVEKTKRLLVATKNLLDRDGIALRVVLIPALEQVYPDQYPFAQEIDLDKPQRVMSALLREHGVKFFDLLPFMRAVAEKGFYFPEDQHWTNKGHAFAAGEVAKYLEAQGLVPAVRVSP